MPSLTQRLARLAPYFRASRPGFALAFAAAAIGAATEPAIPALLKPLLDRGFPGGTGSAPGFALWMVPAAIIGLYLIRGLAHFVAQYALSWAANRGVLQLREAMFERLMDAEPALFSRSSASALTNTLVYEVQQGANWLSSALMTLVRDSLTVLALLGYLLYLNWKLTLFVLVLTPAVAVVVRVVSKRLRRLTVAGQEATDSLAYAVEENVLAWRMVRLHDAGATQARRFGAQSQRLRRLMLKVAAAAATASPITQLLTATALSAVIMLALWQGSQGETVGSFVAFVTAMLMLSSPLKHLTDLAGPMTRGLTALERALDLIEATPREVGGTYTPAAVPRHDGHHTAGAAQARDEGRANGAITLDHVSLRYRDDQPAALDDVSLDIVPGSTVALVGPSGAGKTSLVNLLPRFLDPTSGRIALDGVPLAEWQLAALRRQFAFVSQDVVLFNTSIAANVALGAEDDAQGATFDEARVRSALGSANLLDFVDRLPQGLHSIVGHNGRELSGGQRQRLAIARALYKDAPVLILDEATSALDSESERAVQAALEVLMQGRTTIVIAHRLSTIEHADKVVAMEHGRVVEQGPPAELLTRGGLYARLHATTWSPHAPSVAAPTSEVRVPSSGPA